MTISREHIENRTAGFSLIEIMLVVAIMGMLAALVAVGISKQQITAMRKITYTAITNIGSGIRLYDMNVGHLPDTFENLLKKTDEPNWSGPYLENCNGVAPVDAWGTTFQYTKKEDGAFEVRSAGPDKRMNTEDDLTN